MINNIQDKKYPELADFCKKLLSDFQNNIINEEELDKELCYASLKYGFDELGWMAEPVPPQIMLAYKSLDKRGKREFVKSNEWFFRDGEAAMYLEDLSKIDHLNYRNENHLKFMLETLKDDPVSSARIKEKLYIYQMSRQ